MRYGSTPIIPGEAQGSSLVLDQPLSWWGGVDPVTGTVIDRNHPRRGTCLTGRILILPHGRGSSGGSAVLAESMRLQTAPSALILREVDPILVVGVTAGMELYENTTCPLLVADSVYHRLRTNRPTRVYRDGTIEQS